MRLGVVARHEVCCGSCLFQHDELVSAYEGLLIVVMKYEMVGAAPTLGINMEAVYDVGVATVSVELGNTVFFRIF